MVTQKKKKPCVFVYFYVIIDLQKKLETKNKTTRSYLYEE